MKCCSLQNTAFKYKEPRFLIGDLNKFELSDVFFKKRKDIIKPSIDKTCVFQCVFMFEKLLMGDRYYYETILKQ